MELVGRQDYAASAEARLMFAWVADFFRTFQLGPDATELAPVEAPTTCPICLVAKPTFVLACEHGVCKHCAVAYVRGALGDQRTQVQPRGIRCPMHAAGCEAFIGPSDAAKLLTDTDARQLAQLALRGETLRTRAAAAAAVSTARGALVPGQLLALLLPLRARLGTWLGGGGASLPEDSLTLDEVRRYAPREAIHATARHIHRPCVCPHAPPSLASSAPSTAADPRMRPILTSPDAPHSDVPGCAPL